MSAVMVDVDELKRMYAYLIGDTLAFYDSFRAAGAQEIDARHVTERYLRRKAAGMLDADGAAIVLADALARRGAQRLATAEVLIIQR